MSGSLGLPAAELPKNVEADTMTVPLLPVQPFMMAPPSSLALLAEKVEAETVRVPVPASPLSRAAA